MCIICPHLVVYSTPGQSVIALYRQHVGLSVDQEVVPPPPFVFITPQMAGAGAGDEAGECLLVSDLC